LETLQTGPLIDAPSNRTRKIIPISVIVVVIVGLILSILTQPFAAPSIEDAGAAVETSLEQAPGEAAPEEAAPEEAGSVQPAESGRAQEKGVDLTGGLAWIGQIVISFIALLSSIGELTGVKVSSLFSSGKAKTNVEEFPFHVIQDFDALLEYLFPEPKIALISDRSIPYLPQIRDETDAAFQGRGLVLIRGRSKTGKTREACELLRRWWYLGPTVLVARSHVTLKPPFKIPANLPTRNLVLVFDDIDRYLGDAAALRRLDETLRFFQSICHDRGEVRVIATARQEEEFWRRLGYDAGQSPWTQFELVQLDPLTPEKAETVIAELAQAAEIEIAPEQARALAEKNDGTFLNLALAFRGWMSRGIKTITADEARSFEGALKSTWRRRYEELVKARPTVGPVYAAVDFMQSHNLPLRPEMIGELAAEMSMGKGLLTVLGWFDRLRAWADRAPALNWYRSPKTRARGWALIIAGGLALLYLLIYGFLRFAPGDLQNRLSRSVYESLGAQLLCLTPLLALVIPLAVYVVVAIARNRALSRTAKTLNFLISTEVPLRGNELRPYENQFENNGCTRNWDPRCYAGGLPDRRFASLYAPRLAGVYLGMAERLRLNGEVSAARELAAASCKIAPGDPAAPFLLGKIAFDGADYRGAIDLFATSRGLYGRSNNACRALEREALCHLYLGNHETAESTALEALRGWPALCIARWTLGLAQMRLGKKLEGEQHCRQAVSKKQPVPVEVQHALEADEGLQAIRAIAVPAVKEASAGRKTPAWRKTVMKTLPVLLSIAAISATFLFLVFYIGRQVDEEQSSLRLMNTLLKIFPGAPALLNQRALNYTALENNEDAMADFSEAIRADPKFSTAYVNRGWTYFYNLNDSKKAMADLTEAIRLDPEYQYAYDLRGEIYRNLHQYEQAIADCTEALRIDPQYVRAYNGRGLAYQDQGEYQKAMDDFSEAIRLNPDYQWAYANRGNVYKSLNQYEQAIADYSEAIRIDPQYDLAYILRGQAYEHQGEYEKAIADYSEAIRLDPNYVYAYEKLIEIYRSLGENEKATAFLTEIIRTNPNYAYAYEKLIEIYRSLGENEKAIVNLTEIIRINPNTAYAYASRGRMFSSLGRIEEAIADFSEAIRINPQESDYYEYRGDAYLELGEKEKAIADYTDAMRIDDDNLRSCGSGNPTFKDVCYHEWLNYNPQDAYGYIFRGDAHIYFGEYEEAIKDYTEASRIDPENADAYSRRGGVYAYLGEYDQAVLEYIHEFRLRPRELSECTYGRNSPEKITCFTEALKADPKSVYGYSSRAVEYASIGEYEKAFADYAEAIRIDPNDIVVYLWRARTYEELGNYEAAIADYTKLIQIRPQDKSLYEDRGRLYKKLGEYEKALADGTQGIRIDPQNASAYASRGWNYYHLGELEKAAVDFNEAIRLGVGAENPSTVAYTGLGGVYYELGEYEKASAQFINAYHKFGGSGSCHPLFDFEIRVACYSNLIHIDPQNGFAYTGRGEAYIELGEYEKAFADYAEAIRMQPEKSVMFIDRGDAYSELGEYEKALADYSEAIRLDSQSYNAYHRRGNVFVKLGNYEQALADFSEAIRIYVMYADAYKDRGSVYYTSGEFEKALADYTKAILIEPSDASLYKARAEIYQALCKEAEAAADLRRYEVMTSGP